MKRSVLIAIVILMVVTGLVQLVRLFAPSGSIWGELSAPQAIAFPIFFLALWHITILGGGIPRVVLILAAVCAVGAAGFSFAWRGDRRTDFLVARLRGDRYEAESKIFRDQINSEIPAGSAVRAVRYYRELDRFTDSQKALDANRSVPAIVWGGPEWISLSFASQDGVARIGEFAPSFAFGSDLAIVTQISRIDISRHPEKYTGAFIAKVVAGLLPERRVGGVRLPSDERTAELALRDGGQIVQRWRSFTHRGFAAFALGNFYLLDAIAQNLSDPGTVRCAVSIYGFGRRLFRAAENPELAMALANNEGVARAMLAALSGDRVELGRAEKLWRIAERGPAEMKRLADAPQARLAAWINQSSTIRLSRSAPRRKGARR